MKKYAVFAKRVKNPDHSPHVIWHFLNDTNDFDEAFFWYMSSNQSDEYTEVQIVQSVQAKVVLS